MEFDDDRFFSGASRGDYLEALTAHAGLGSVVILDGAPGSGVSTLLGQAVMALLDDLEVVRIDGNDPHDGNVVVKALLLQGEFEVQHTLLLPAASLAGCGRRGGTLLR